MKKVSILLAVMMILTAGAAFAQSGNNLSWNDCGANGLQNRTDLCTNSGLRSMIASFVHDQSIPTLGGEQWTADLVTNSPTLDPWWNVTSARWSYLVTNPTGAGCDYDVWNASLNAPQGPVSVPLGGVVLNANRLRLQGAQAFVFPETGEVFPGLQSYNFTLQLKYSLGTAGNPGCLATACIVLGTTRLQSEGVPETQIIGPFERDYVTWRGATGILCPDATPTKKATWGSIKALYR